LQSLICTPENFYQWLATTTVLCTIQQPSDINHIIARSLPHRTRYWIPRGQAQLQENSGVVICGGHSLARPLPIRILHHLASSSSGIMLRSHLRFFPGTLEGSELQKLGSSPATCHSGKFIRQMLEISFCRRFPAPISAHLESLGCACNTFWPKWRLHWNIIGNNYVHLQGSTIFMIDKRCQSFESFADLVRLCVSWLPD